MEYDLERIQQLAWRDIFDAAPADVVQTLGVKRTEIGSADAFATYNISWGMLNRTLRADQSQGTAAHAGEIVTWMQAHCAPVWRLEIAPDTFDASVLQSLNLNTVTSGVARLRRSMGSTAVTGSDRIVVACPDTASLFGDLAGRALVDMATGSKAEEGRHLLSPLAAWFSCLVGRPGWLCYIGHDEGQPASASAMFFSGETAWLGLMGTTAQHRRKGLQSVVIARRLADASALGINVLSVEAVPPDGSDRSMTESYRNLLGMGFSDVYCKPYLSRRNP